MMIMKKILLLALMLNMGFSLNAQQKDNTLNEQEQRE